MKTALCDMLGIDIPLVAFSHCRDVVAAVTNAGGFGILGAGSHTPEHLEEELTWIDEHVGGRPYGADFVVPDKFEGKGERLSDEELVARIPQSHRDFVAGVLASHGIEADPATLVRTSDIPISDDLGERLLDVALRHPIKLVANALGVPPQYMIDRAHAAGIPVAALVGAKEHAVKQVDAGVDLIVAQGTEAAGHCGEVSTMVLVPEVVEAVNAIRPVPVLAAGGIVTGRQMAAAIALGAAGAWTGSVWLTTREAETAPHTVQKMLAATSRDTVRSRSRTGKLSRQLVSAWTKAWEASDAPTPLLMPLQPMLTQPSLARVDKLAERGHEGAQRLATYWVGQGVGLMNKQMAAADVVREMAEDYLDAVDRVASSVDD
jgi:NAD(P)H-dependent flavin oxidoreductase YrpB (nitropropane dioxygenase family)